MRTPLKTGRYSVGNGDFDGPLRIWDDTGKLVADVPLGRNKDADAFVLAVNNHEALVSALRWAVDYITTPKAGGSMSETDSAKLKQADDLVRALA